MQDNKETQILTKNQQSTQKKLSTCESIQEAIKMFFFKLFYVLLEECNISGITLVLTLIIQIGQLLSLSFLTPNHTSSPWTNQFGSNYAEIFLLSFRFLPWCVRINSQAVYLIVLYFCVFFIISVCAMAIFAYRKYQAHSNYSFGWYVAILKTLCMIILVALYIPILEMLTSPLVCITSADGTTSNMYFASLSCWTGMSILHDIVGLTFAIIFTFICLIISIFFCDTSYNTSANSFGM